jgi:four helix bundle protein
VAARRRSVHQASQADEQTFSVVRALRVGVAAHRAACSVPANIAEGFGRRHWRERRHFLIIAESSLAEVTYCIHAAGRLGYFDRALVDELTRDAKQVGAPLAGLIRSVRRDAQATSPHAE